MPLAPDIENSELAWLTGQHGTLIKEKKVGTGEMAQQLRALPAALLEVPNSILSTHAVVQKYNSSSRGSDTTTYTHTHT